MIYNQGDADGDSADKKTRQGEKKKKKKTEKKKRADVERGSRAPAAVGYARQSRLSSLILGFVAQRKKKKKGSTRAGLRFISYVRGTI